MNYEENEPSIKFWKECWRQIKNDARRTFIRVPARERLWKALLLSFGDRVKVVGPEDYQVELIETARKFLSNYDIQLSREAAKM